jgi:transcriptional regulator with XRE-family HTH domain
MPRKSTLKLPPLDLGPETLGSRISRIRKEKGYTQIELAKKMGLVQTLITDYECDRLRPYPEMIVRFAQALEITTDELLGLSPSAPQNTEGKPDVKIVKRVKKIQNLPPSQQKALLKTIDTFLKGAEK